MTASELQPTHQRTQVGENRVVNSFNGESNQEASPFRQNSNDIIAENLAEDNKELCMLLEEIPQCLDIKEIQTCITIVEEDQQRTIETVFKPVEKALQLSYPLLAKRKIEYSMVMISSIFKQKKNLHTSHAWAAIKTTSKIDTDSAVAIFTYRLNILPKLMEKRRVRTLDTGLLMIKLEAKSQSSANRTKEAHTSSPSTKLTKLRDQYFPISTKLTMLKEELKTLIDHEEEIEEKLECAYKALKKVEQQENTNHRQSVDDTLEIMILNKEISKISIENMRLEKELDEANQDTKILLKQVSELLAVPDNRKKDKMPIKCGGSFKKNYYYSTDQD